MTRFFKGFLIFLLTSFPLFGQNSSLVEPIFPVSNPGLVYWEAEDAVATNFAQQANLDYSSSGQRQLQLNQQVSLSQPYYAEYVVQVPQTGTYEFWYGGTPAGPATPLAASYASPFELSVDNGTPIAVNREDINVVTAYSPVLFWNRLRVTLNLSTGIHRIKIEVSQKRRFDGRYFLFLDAFFLKDVNSPEPNRNILPAVFPKNLNDRSIDPPYLSIADYQNAVASDPSNLAPYLELTQVYTLLADYRDALKTLAGARLAAPTDASLLLWIAREDLWSGEIDDALQYYRQYLVVTPHVVNVWAEAAKEMAWSGRYTDALALYQAGLTNNPGNLNLEVNQALTLQWAGQVTQGQTKINEVFRQLGLKSEDWQKTATIFDVNGYPDEAAKVDEKAIKLFPREIAFRLALMDVLTRNGKASEAELVRNEIQKIFVPSETLKSFLTSFQQQIALRQTVLDEFKTQLAQNPDNLALRQTYIDALFWNGKKKEAIVQFENSLANELYRRVMAEGQSSQDVQKIIDEESVLRGVLKTIQKKLLASHSALQKALDDWKNAAQNKSNALADAQNNLALATAVSAFWAKSADTLEGIVANILQVHANGAQQVQIARQKLAALAAPLHWRWDSNLMIDELSQASSNGFVLADAVKLRIFSLEGDSQTLEKLIQKVTSLDPRDQNLAFQSQLWLNPFVPGHWPKDYHAYAVQLAAKAKAWLPLPPTFAVWDPKVPATAQSYLATLGVQAGFANKADQSLNGDSQVWKDLLLTRLQITFFGYNQDTVSQRYQLGEDLISANELAGAEIQLRQVLKMDPWNDSARFRLGNVAQMIGNWSLAMDLYKKVYQTDPKFSNAASLYNQVAGQHPWNLASQDKEFIDSLRYQRTTDLTIQKDLSPALSGLADYGTTSTALHDHHGGYQEMHASLQLGFHPWGNLFTLTPSVGGSYWSSVYRYGATPFGGLDARWGDSTFNLDASYNYGILADSRLDEGPDLWTHTLTGQASYLLQLPTTGTLQSLSGRTWVQNQILTTDGNSILTASQEANAIFHVADSPWTIFQLNVSGVWESAKISPAPVDLENENRYYAPQGDLTIKGGASLSTWIGMGGGAVLGWTLRGAWGPYWQDFGTVNSVQYLVNEVETRGEFTWGDWSAFIDLYYSKTPIATDSSYWSSQATIGLSAKLPNDLVP